MKRFSQAPVDDKETTNILQWVMLGALLHNQESGLEVTAEDLVALNELKSKLGKVDPVPGPEKEKA